MIGLQTLTALASKHPVALAATPRSSATSQSSGAGQAGDTTPPPSNQLDANSFITLLTAQLQAQDPLDPMNPQEMVNELVSMNSLQQLIQIQQDLATIGGLSTGASGSSNSAAATPAAQNAATIAPAPAPSPSYHDAVMQQRISTAPAAASF